MSNENVHDSNQDAPVQGSQPSEPVTEPEAAEEQPLSQPEQPAQQPQFQQPVADQSQVQQGQQYAQQPMQQPQYQQPVPPQQPQYQQPYAQPAPQQPYAQPGQPYAPQPMQQPQYQQPGQPYVQQPAQPAKPVLPPAFMGELKAGFANGRGLAALGAVLGVLVVVSFIFGLFLMPLGSAMGGAAGSDDSILSGPSPLVFAGVVLGGYIFAGAQAMGFTIAGGTLSVLFILAWAVICTLIWVVLKRFFKVQRDNTNLVAHLVRTVLEALAIGLVTSILFGFWRLRLVAPLDGGDLSFDNLGSLSMGPGFFHIFLNVTFFVGITLFFTRKSLPASWKDNKFVAELLTGAREFVQAHAVLFAIFAPFALILGIVFFAKTDGVSVTLVLPLLANIIIWITGMCFFGGFSVGGSMMDMFGSGGSYGGSGTAMIWNFHPIAAVIGFILAIVAIIAMAIHIGARRTRTGSIQWARIWQMPVIGLLAWLIVGLWLSNVSMHMFGESASLGMSWWTPFTVAILGLFFASLLAEILPEALVDTPLLPLLAGKKTAQAWRQQPAPVQAAPQQQYGYGNGIQQGMNAPQGPQNSAQYNQYPQGAAAAYQQEFGSQYPNQGYQPPAQDPSGSADNQAEPPYPPQDSSPQQ
ncbi:MAG: hypothetical protein E6132_02075 [Actinomyces sp.]|nr:hypothetical protein [Actinomyces sp.]